MTAAPRITLPAEPLVDGATALRPWRDDDVETFVEICRDPQITRWIHLAPDYGPADARAYIAIRRDSAQVGIGASFAVTDFGDGTLLGSISLMRISWRHRRAEVGYWLGAPARGRGHASRALGLITRWGFRSLGLERIELLAATENPASQAVAQRTGFTREALLRAYFRDTEDMVCFGLLSGDRLG